MKTTPPFISEVVEEFVRVYWGSPENPEYNSYISKDIWLTEKLTAVYERGIVDGEVSGRKKAVDSIRKQINSAGGIGGNGHLEQMFLSALTTEGK